MNVGPPPVDGHGKLKSRRLAAGTIWYRIGHRRYGTALHFSTGAAARWNDPLDRYGVLYLADAPATAFAETFGHDVSEQYPPATDKFVTGHPRRAGLGSRLSQGRRRPSSRRQPPRLASDPEANPETPEGVRQRFLHFLHFWATTM